MGYYNILQKFPEEWRLAMYEFTDALEEKFREQFAVRRQDFDELKKVVTELAEAQKRSEHRLERLEKSVNSLAKQVGGLSETVGGDIEDIAYIVLYDVLKREFGWNVGVLERVWQNWGEEPEEVNIFGQAEDTKRPDTDIWIVGEAKHNLSAKEVKKFIGQLQRAKQNLSGEIFPVCFCYRARPEVQQMLHEAGIRLVFSYGKLV